MGGASAVAGSWADPGRILGGSCADPGRNLSRPGARHHLQTGRRVAEHPLRYHMMSCRGLPPAPTWNKVSHFCNSLRLPCAQCAEHEALETAHTSQRIMEIYLQGLQRSERTCTVSDRASPRHLPPYKHGAGEREPGRSCARANRAGARRHAPRARPQTPSATAEGGGGRGRVSQARAAPGTDNEEPERRGARRRDRFLIRRGRHVPQGSQSGA